MTRDSLRCMEGQLVIFNGRISSASPTKDDGRRDFLFTTVRAWKWDGDSALPFHQSPDARLEHAWISLPAGVKNPVEMLRRAEGVARVGWYARADGSADLGLQIQPCLNLDEFVEGFHKDRRTAPRDLQIQCLNRVLQSCKEPGNYSFSQWCTTTETLNTLAQYRDRLVRSQEKEEAIKATAHRGRRPTSAARFADLLRQPQQLKAG